MSKLREEIQGLALTVGFAACVYFGFVDGHDGARNIAQFLIWAIHLPLGVLGVLSSTLQDHIAAKPPGPRSLSAFRRVLSWSELAIIVWSGAMLTATVFAVGVFLLALARESIKAKRAALAEGAAS